MANLTAPVNIAGVTFANSVMNGAYIGSKTIQDAKTLAQSSSGAVIIGSISIKPRHKNFGQNYWLHKDGFFSLNSYGLPNGGLPYYQTALPKMVALAHSHGKPLIANIVGFSDNEFGQLIKFAETAGADMVELNLGCPNAWDNGRQKQIISYHPKLVRNVLRHIRQLSLQIPLAVKISPLPPDLLRDVAKEISDSRIVQAVTATNSYPNAAITSGAGKRGLDEKLVGFSGRALKPISLGVVQQLRRLLPEDISIIGCGGISTTTDAQDYLQAGASAVQIASALKDSGLALFDTVLA